jgi:hypothetical protein
MNRGKRGAAVKSVFFFGKKFSEEWPTGKKEVPLPGNGRKFLEKFGARTVSWLFDRLMMGEGGGLPRGGRPRGEGVGWYPWGWGAVPMGEGVGRGYGGYMRVCVIATPQPAHRRHGKIDLEPL